MVMANTIIMSKYQGLGNDYLILDPKKNQVQLQRTVCFALSLPDRLF